MNSGMVLQLLEHELSTNAITDSLQAIIHL